MPQTAQSRDAGAARDLFSVALSRAAAQQRRHFAFGLDVG